MEVTDQFHSPVPLILTYTEQEAWASPKPVWILWWREKFLPLPVI